MRLLLFFCLFSLFLSAAQAQRIAGSIVDRQGRSVEYVNVGVEGTQTGVVSDGQGRFALTIPDSLAGGTLYVSHITYEPKRIPLREALRQGANGEPLTIELAERAFAIPEIVVRPRRPRYRQVGGGGVRVALPPGISIAWGISTERKENQEETAILMREHGTVLKIREPLLIEEVSFAVNSCTDSLLFRVNLYQIENDTVFTPLHRIPFYVLVEPSKKEWIYGVDVSEGTVVARPGNILVSLEQIYSYGKKGSEWFVPVLYFGEARHRDRFQPEFRRSDPIHMDLQVYGRVLPE